MKVTYQRSMKDLLIDSDRLSVISIRRVIFAPFKKNRIFELINNGNGNNIVRLFREMNVITYIVACYIVFQTVFNPYTAE